MYIEEVVTARTFSCSLFIIEFPNYCLGSGVTLYNSLGEMSGIFHCNNQNNQLERRVRPPRYVPWMPCCGLEHCT